MSSDQNWDISDERRRGIPPPPGRPTPLPIPSPGPRYSLADLEREAKTSGRTIRYYISEGLLPPAYGRGPTATYDLGHLLRLRLIVSLKENRLGLQEIRDKLNGLTDDDIAAMLNVQTEPTAGILAPDRAPSRHRAACATANAHRSRHGRCR